MAYSINAGLGGRSVYRTNTIYEVSNPKIYNEVVKDENKLSPGSKFYSCEGEFYELKIKDNVGALTKIEEGQHRDSVKSRFEIKRADHLRFEKIFAEDMQKNCCMVKDDYAIELINQGAYKFKVPEKCLPQNVIIHNYSSVPVLYDMYFKDTENYFNSNADVFLYIHVIISFRAGGYNNFIGYYFDNKKDSLSLNNGIYFRVVPVEKWIEYMKCHDLEYEDIFKRSGIGTKFNRHDIMDLD